MIRYPTTCKELVERIQSTSDSWLARAADGTKRCAAAGKFVAGAPDWSEIKSVYMELQNNKCAYCERRLEEFPIEHDVEHFRPKNAVKAWPSQSDGSVPNYPFSTGSAFSCGYFWLAYSMVNYATACKSCNSRLKANYFPIGGKRGRSRERISGLKGEEPLLVYPIGMIDTDPANLITFDGILAVPRYSYGPERRRAQVTIDFFWLNERDLLLDERAAELMQLGDALRDMHNSRDRARLRTVAGRIQELCSASAPHAGCKRAFRRVWYEDRPYAERILSECKQRES